LLLAAYGPWAQSCEKGLVWLEHVAHQTAMLQQGLHRSSFVLHLVHCFRQIQLVGQGCFSFFSDDQLVAGRIQNTKFKPTFFVQQRGGHASDRRTCVRQLTRQWLEAR